MLQKDKTESESRLGVRVPGSMKSRFKTAAGIMGVSLSDFVKTHLYEAVKLSNCPGIHNSQFRK